MKILRNKWLITNYVLFAILGIVLGRILDLSFSDYKFWLLIILIVTINFTATFSMKKDIELSNKLKP